MSEQSSLVIASSNIPSTIEDISRFVLVGREKLTAVRAEINAIKKVGLAKEVLEQKKTEAQEIAELVTLAEVKIGAMLKEIPKASGGDHGNQWTGGKIQPVVNFGNAPTDESEQKTKAETIEELGFNRQQASQFQQMAEHEDVVMEAIAEARENDDIISRSAVLKKIDEAKKPHVAFNSGNNEWYTPKEYIEAARQAMGSIDIDPASSEIANEVVQAKEYYTAETNGLDKKLHGNVWMNPPYSSELIGLFISKIVEEREDYKQAVVLVNNATETEWFNKLISVATAVCFPKSRVKFYMPDGKTGAPLQGQAVIYIGENVASFLQAFSGFGWECEPAGV